MPARPSPDLAWVLASASPRRQTRLAQFGLDFEVLPADLDEDVLTTEDPFETARILALAKARHVSLLRPNAMVIGGDTVVASPNASGGYHMFGKPHSPADCVRVLNQLSGKTHLVISGLALVWPGGEAVECESCAVTFRVLGSDEIEEYSNTEETLDKAGGYAIQGEASKFVAQINGNIDCVVGFPTQTFRKLLGI